MMAYRASTYRPGIEDEPNSAADRVSRERSPRRNGIWSPGRRASIGQGQGRFVARENRSRSPERGIPVSGSLRRISESERKNYDREFRAKKAHEYKKENSEKSSERRQQEVLFNESSDITSDRKQGARPHIGGFADELIRDAWQRGARVSKENSPRFAAEVLLHVKRRFNDEFAKDNLKRDLPNGTQAAKLLLENMRWISDTKITPLTDSNDLYLCNGCENNQTLYSLESLLHHYATKHTTTFSNGAIVVDWKAEWPELPPFNPEPETALKMLHSLASNMTSINGIPTAPRKLIPNSELDKKMKWEQEIREREIRIKEANEENQRKEREMRKTENECRGRQFQADGVDERTKRRPDPHAEEVTACKGPSNNHSSLVSGIEQDGRLSLRDITNTLQPDRATATDCSQENFEQMVVDSKDYKSHIRRTKSIRRGNMETNDPNLRASQRLYLTSLFTRFMSEVSEQTALQLRRDSAKKILEQKTAAYDKAQILLKEFPSAEESTKASKEKAWRDFEKVDQELVKKREDSMKLSEEISEIVYPEEEPPDDEQGFTSKIKDLDEKLGQYQAESELVKRKQQEMDELCSTFMTQKDRQIIKDSIGDALGSVRKDISDLSSKTLALDAEIPQLRQSLAFSDLRSSFEGISTRIEDLEKQRTSTGTTEVKSIVDALSSRVDELQRARAFVAELEPRKPDEDISALRNTMSILSSRLDGLEKDKMELSHAVETVKGNLALQTAAVNDRSEIQNIHSSINSLCRSEGELRASLGKFQGQLQALGKDLRATKIVDRGNRFSDAVLRDTTLLSNEVRIAIHDEIRAQQEAVDTVLNEKFGSIDEQAGDLRAEIKNLGQQTAEIDATIKSLRHQFATHSDRTMTDLASVRGDVNSTREEINSLRQNEIESFRVATTSLDYRMNNLSTEYLARQILGQLDAHIRGSDNNIGTLEFRMQDLERRAISGDGFGLSKKDVDESLQRIRKDLFVVVDERVIKVKNMFIELNAELVNEQMQLRTGLEKNQSNLENIKVDLETSKTNNAERVGSLKTEVDTLSSKLQRAQEDLGASKIDCTDSTKSLRAELDSIGPTLQNVQDDLRATKGSCRESAAGLKAEISKATKMTLAEKRKMDSPETVKTNGHKRNRTKQPRLDSEDDN